MTSIIKVHVLSGAMDESPPCYILQVDEFRILLDCGWDENFDQDFIKELKKYVNQIDAVLLSYPDPLHLGALPYMVGKCGLSCPIYATIPVYKMGQMFMYDLYQSRHDMEEFDMFTLDDVDAAFDKIVQLKYNQSINMKGKGYGITITPLPAGHMIGGTMWKIVKVGEEDIIYAVDFNHKKERHLNGCELERLQRPSLLITDAFNATYQQARRRARDEKLMTKQTNQTLGRVWIGVCVAANILQTLRDNGNVLVAVDTADRVLELAHMLDQLWRNKDSGLLAYSLALLSNVVYVAANILQTLRNNGNVLVAVDTAGRVLELAHMLDQLWCNKVSGLLAYSLALLSNVVYVAAKILQTLRNNGNVLVAVDTAGRVLELAHMLDQLWRNKDSGLLAYSLALLSNVVYVAANILQTLRDNGNVLVAVDTAGRVLELAHMLDQLWRNKDSGLLAYSLALLSNVVYVAANILKTLRDNGNVLVAVDTAGQVLELAHMLDQLWRNKDSGLLAYSLALLSNIVYVAANILQTLRNNGNVLVAVDTADRVLELAHMLDQLWRNKDLGLLAYSLALLSNIVYVAANILQTLRNNGNVLVAVDTAGRVLELAHMLDQLWRNKDSGLLAYSLALLSNVVYVAANILQTLRNNGNELVAVDTAGRVLELAHMLDQLWRNKDSGLLAYSLALLSNVVYVAANILQTLRNNGNVLVAVDTAGRVLELAHMLDQLWRNKDSGLLAYSLALLNNVSYNVVEFAKSQIEWMSDKLMRSFEGARNNPFQFKHVQMCHSMSELSRVPSPKVVLASSPDMECGFSRELFLQWCTKPQNSIIITNRTSPGTLARELIDGGGNRTIQLEVKKRVRLEGAELEEYLQKEREKEKEKEKSEYDVYLSSDSEDELELAAIKGKHDLLVVKSEIKTQGGGGGGGFFKSSKKQHPMFPFYEEKIKFDEYGEIIRPEDYKLADASMEVEENKENVDQKEEDLTMDITEEPTKCVKYLRQVQVAAQVQFIDFEGRSDGESIQKILAGLKPRRLVLVRGSPESTLALEAHAKQRCGDARVFAPSRGEVVDATTETHIYQVRLTDALVSSMEFKKAKDSELAWLDAVMVTRSKAVAKPLPEGTAGALPPPTLQEDIETEENPSDEIYTLEPLPPNEITGHQPSFINELKLSDFKQVLTKYNIPSEFSGGVLWCCNNTVAVRRHEAGKVTLEGCLSEDYYRVRELLYEQYAIV